MSISLLETPATDLTPILEHIGKEEARLLDFEQKARDYANYEHNLEVAITHYEELEDIQYDFEMKKALWHGLRDWNYAIEEWKKCTLKEIPLELMTSEIRNYLKIVGKVGRHLSPEHDVIQLLRKKVGEVKKAMPIAVHLGSGALKDRHWVQLKEKIKYDVQSDKHFTLGTIFEKKLVQFEKVIGDIAVQASQEAALIEMLQKVIDLWEECDMPLQAYKEMKDVYTLANLDDIVANLDESLVTITTINASRYVEPIRDDVNEWRGKLVLFQETLDEWMTMQRKWMYLETIFSGGDIAKQLPSETQLFTKIDKYWKNLMLLTWENPDAITVGTYAGRKEVMITHNGSLDRIEKSLEDYLETKRQIFPRFYFLSNDELLEILADSKNPHKVQPHLRKCFDNIYRLIRIIK